MLLGQFYSLVDHANGARRGRRDNHFRAEETHQLASLDAESLRHGHHQGIAFGSADHGEADAGVSAGGFHDRLAGLQLAGALCFFNHTQSETILDRAQRIERLDLDIEVYIRRCETVDLDHRRIADRFRNACKLAHSSTSECTQLYRREATGLQMIPQVTAQRLFEPAVRARIGNRDSAASQ